MTQSTRHTGKQDSTAAVDAFLTRLEHPHKAEIQTLRELILGIDPAVAEGIKWNAPSYRTTEYFATTNLRAKKGIGLILHLGAKVRDLPGGTIAIDDPAKLLTWLGKDRASVEFASARELADNSAVLRAILAQWITHV